MSCVATVHQNLEALSSILGSAYYPTNIHMNPLSSIFCSCPITRRTTQISSNEHGNFKNLGVPPYKFSVGDSFSLGLVTTFPRFVAELPSILKYLKGGLSSAVENTHKPNMHQPMQSHGQKISSFWQKMHHAAPCIKLVPPNRNPNLDLSLLNLPPLTPPISFIISSRNPCKISLI